MRESAAESELRQEAKLWTKMSKPFSLVKFLPLLTKCELSKIAEGINRTKLSALKKDEMIQAITALLPELAAAVFEQFDEERYNLVKKTVAAGGLLYISDISPKKIRYFREKGILFSGTHEGKNALMMPVELLESFRRWDRSGVQETIRRNAEDAQLIHGLLHYYGFLGKGQLEEMVEELTGRKRIFIEFLPFVLDLMAYSDRIREFAYGLCDARAGDPQSIIDEQKARPSVKFKKIPKSQLLRAGLPDYYKKTPFTAKLRELLTDHYDLTNQEAEELVKGCVEIVQTDGQPQEVIAFLNQHLEFPSFNFVQQLMGLIMELHNTTSMWALKGHCPKEIRQTERQHLQPLPETPYEMSGVPREKKVKIGRNEPCPCGSGKKYKKCCGGNGQVIPFPERR